MDGLYDAVAINGTTCTGAAWEAHPSACPGCLCSYGPHCPRIDACYLHVQVEVCSPGPSASHEASISAHAMASPPPGVSAETSSLSMQPSVQEGVQWGAADCGGNSTVAVLLQQPSFATPSRASGTSFSAAGQAVQAYEPMDTQHPADAGQVLLEVERSALQLEQELGNRWGQLLSKSAAAVRMSAVGGDVGGSACTQEDVKLCGHRACIPMLILHCPAHHMCSIPTAMQVCIGSAP